MKLNASNYTLTTILSIINKNNQVHPIAFYFQTFTFIELNYDTCNKELLAIFEDLKDLVFSINIIIDYKNLEYFSTTKMLTCKQM